MHCDSPQKLDVIRCPSASGATCGKGSSTLLIYVLPREKRHTLIYVVPCAKRAAHCNAYLHC